LRNEALNLWLKRFAWTNVQNDSARVYVLHGHDNVVLGYHAITVGSVSREEAPERMSKGLAAHPIGVAVLGRLAVDAAQQGKGLGVTLLRFTATYRAGSGADWHSGGARAGGKRAGPELLPSIWLQPLAGG
jgi:GNAT superfamily N-acetyltransferase